MADLSLIQHSFDIITFSRYIAFMGYNSGLAITILIQQMEQGCLKGSTEGAKGSKASTGRSKGSTEGAKGSNMAAQGRRRWEYIYRGKQAQKYIQAAMYVASSSNEYHILRSIKPYRYCSCTIGSSYHPKRALICPRSHGPGTILARLGGQFCPGTSVTDPRTLKRQLGRPLASYNPKCRNVRSHFLDQ